MQGVRLGFRLSGSGFAGWGWVLKAIAGDDHGNPLGTYKKVRLLVPNLSCCLCKDPTSKRILNLSAPGLLIWVWALGILESLYVPMHLGGRHSGDSTFGGFNLNLSAAQDAFVWSPKASSLNPQPSTLNPKPP